jgi:2-oxoglutarate dehydrogenase E2 component (dihydrolipoamide succinyltransferase)
MAIELKVPEVGESITEVQIAQWLKHEGDRVEKDENLVEIETDKATVELPSPAAGVITKLIKGDGQPAMVGEVIGYLDTAAASTSAPAARDGDESAAAQAKKQAAAEILTPKKEKAAPASTIAPGATTTAQETAKPAPPPSAPAKPAAAKQPESVAREPEKLAAKSSQPPSSPPPSSQPQSSRPQSSAPQMPSDQALVVSNDVARPIARERKPAHPETIPMPAAAQPRGAREEEVVPMSPIRRRIAQRLVEAQQTAALLTTFNEVDMSAVIALRGEHRDAFQEKFGVKLGFMSFFVKAAVDALKHVPQINAEIRGNDIVYHNFYDIGIAVGGGKGLVVPVLRDADRMSFAEIEATINDLAQRARDNSLSLEELQGGTFTISNGGVYGSLLSTPIVNPPQSGILGLHAMQDRPVARGGQVVIRPMMYIALTYDHRIVDGQGAVTFLKRIKEIIEEPMRMLVEV